MTREEYEKELKYVVNGDYNGEYNGDCNGDCISRQAVLAETYNWSKDEFLRVTNPFDYLRKRITALPSVTPAEKVGKWIGADVLDKIRADIADLDDADYDYEGYYKAVTDALKIIDKYKAERSEKE